MKANCRKAIKLISLLISTLIIGFVAAQTYSELFMSGSVTIGSAGVKFVAGGNTTTLGGGDAINTAGTVVTFDQIPDIEPGQTVAYDQAVNITSSSSTPKNITMTLESLTGQFSANFEYINITIIAKNGTTLGTNIEAVSSGTNVTSTGIISAITNGETWMVRWIVKTKSDATVGQSASLTLKVKVE